jgi:hypothetical protein
LFNGKPEASVSGQQVGKSNVVAFGLPLNKQSLLALIVFVAAAVLVTPAQAGPVQRHIERVMPRSGQRGTTVEVKIQGVALNDVREAIFYRGGIEAVEFSAPEKLPTHNLMHSARIEQQVTCRFRIAPDCPIGIHAFRLRTDRELTTVSTFRVTPYPVIQEAEKSRGSNDIPAEAESIPQGNTTIGGQVRGDVDCFRVSRKAGERISVEVDAVWLTEIAYGDAENDLSVHILDASGKVIGRNDDSELHVQDPILSIIAPSNGEYTVRVQQSVALDSEVHYLAHVGSFYRPLVAFPPGGRAGNSVSMRWMGDPTGTVAQTISIPDSAPNLSGLVAYFPGDTSEQPPSPLPLRVSSLQNVLEGEVAESPINLPVAINGVIGEGFEEDVYRVRVEKGDRYRVEVFARAVGSPLDPRIWIRKVGSDKIEIEDDDTSIRDSRFYSASNSIQRKELLDPRFVWEPKEGGEYELGITDMRGLGSAMSVYRIELSPARDKINTSLFARVIDSMQCPRLTAIAVPRGNQWTVTFNLKQGIGNRYQGPLELFATGLPDGVQMIAPIVSAGQTTAPAQFVASKEVRPQSALIMVQARPHLSDQAESEPGKTPPSLISHCQESFPFWSHSGGRAWHHVAVDRYALAVTEPAPFTIVAVPPRISLIRNGSLDIAIHVERHGDFKGAVEFKPEWLPGGISGSPAITIEPEESDAVYTLTASGGAPLGTSQLSLVATTTDGIVSGYYTGVDRRRVATSFFPVTIADPHISLASQPTAVRRGARGRVVWKVQLRRPFEGTATAELLGLPKGVSVVGKRPTFDKEQTEIGFEIAVSDETLLGPYRELSCEVALKENGQEIKQRLGRATLRVDP